MELAPVAEAALRHGVSQRTIHRCLSDGRLTRHRGEGSRRTLVDLTEVRRLLAPIAT
jgi:hypothetical protein